MGEEEILKFRKSRNLCVCPVPRVIGSYEHSLCLLCNKQFFFHEGQDKMVYDPERGCVRGPNENDLLPKVETKQARQQTSAKVEKQMQHKEHFTEVKDSGKRQEFETGAVRDAQIGKGMPHLLPSHALLRLAIHFENGAKKYGKNNWRKGLPLSRYLDSAFRHWCAIRDCQKDEDHPTSVLWNIACFIETAHMINEGKLPKELDDIGWFGDATTKESNDI